MKILKISLINILFLIIIFSFAEVIAFVMGYNMQYHFILNRKTTLQYILSRYVTDVNREYYDVPNEKMRPVAGKNF